ncbi:hypothetical protein M513_11933 [Trichuris suis]|uniref:Uncharacterized protein n=1 Tax=Trichuris suis TaxID=68888 RepID=A0A085LQI0_9BILA|nr:hypothetical protein M513_11933 [Trichuris suis]
MLEYMKHYLEYLISRLSDNNVDETDATLRSQLSLTSEPEWWHQVSITIEGTRLTSQDGQFNEELTDEKILHNLKIHNVSTELQPVNLFYLLAKLSGINCSRLQRLYNGRSFVPVALVKLRTLNDG